MRRFILWTAGLLLIATVGAGLFLSYLVLVPTTRSAVQSDLTRLGLQSRTLTSIETNNSVHYGVHLLLGRGLALFPRTRRLADWQYSKARFHARTPYERALLTTDRPHTLAEAVMDAFRLWFGGVKWLGQQAL